MRSRGLVPGKWGAVYLGQGNGNVSGIFRDRASSRTQQCPLLSMTGWYGSEKGTK